VSVETTRNTIAIIIVIGFVFTVGVIGLVPVLGFGKTDISTEYLKTYFSIYSAVVGAIIGYYFGKS
jgi:hypothetical protein